MAFDEDPEVEGSEGGFAEEPNQDMFGNLREVENQGEGFAAEEEGVAPEALRPPPAEAGPPPTAPDSMVPIHALQEERRARQQMQQELEGLRQITTRFDERMRVLAEQEAQRQAALQAEYEAQQDPDPGEDDPLGHEIWTMRQQMAQQAAELEQLRGYTGQVDQVFQAQAIDGQINTVAQWTQQREQQYRAARPDYDDAYRYLLRSRAEEYHAIGMSPEQIQARLHRDQGEVVGLSTQYDQNGTPVAMVGNPCDTIYRLAIQRGFVPGQTKTDAAGTVIQPNGNGNGTWHGYGRVDGRGRIEAAQRAQRQSPGGRGSGVSTRPLDYTTIAHMSDADMAQLAATPQGRRALDIAMGSR